MNDPISPREPLPTLTEAGEVTVDMPDGRGFFTVGQVLGDRYEILEMLGRGGMGEVWRAFDLKLRVEVGLKALREELFQSERRLELLRQEVRAAREVVSPNVCRIFDLIEVDGRELVSMEYVDGATLLGVLQGRGPLELKEAQDIASQFLAGLEAIHKAGLVHRDVKPENIMLTRAGRVVVMDFGLARGPESGAGSVSGTPAYMAPEHAAGQDVDARADVYSAGVVLAEMVSPEGIKSYESRQSVWEGVRSEPAQVPDSPWAPVIKRAVARDRERRQNSAHTLIRELEDVTLRVEGADDLHPYPGLSSFTESDAEYFFGREAEVERMWRMLEGPPRLLGIMGPSGAGKTSFIRAGMTPNAPAGWSIIRFTPGSAAISSLRSALTPELAGHQDLLQAIMADPDSLDIIVHAVSGWRPAQPHALLIVDQFEELFTLNPRPEQARFSALLGRLPLEADTHVVMSMRDDFAVSCNAHEALRPVFHELTVLEPPAGGNLRRALIQPATRCGYRFEDDELVEEILAEVEGERGALPLVAFALARLWEKRDRESGLLTRQAYHDIGGVGGALARHAETTVDRIGVERIPIVRELFRNLVTAEGTRAVREWDELLSVFDEPGPLSSRASKASRGIPRRRQGDEATTTPQPGGDSSTRSSDSLAQNDRKGGASEVLRELIDARLLTSYEVREDENEPIRRVEIIHESLLANWPRLVRWQTQDADAVQVREQLRQAAKIWEEHGRSIDLLWTGSAYRDYALWRERYPGSLSTLEEGFVQAMTTHSQRRRRRRRFAAAVILLLVSAASVVFAALWRRSELETRKAEASKLLALSRTDLDDNPTSALAHVIASLELSDTDEARLAAVETLSRGPLFFLTPAESETGDVRFVRFSPTGRWLAAWDFHEVFLYSQSGGVIASARPTGDLENSFQVFFSSDESTLVAALPGHAWFWSLPDLTPTRSLDFSDDSTVMERRRSTIDFRADRLISLAQEKERLLIRSWPVPNGEPTVHGHWTSAGVVDWGIDETGANLVFADGRRVVSRPLDDLESNRNDRILLTHDRSVKWIAQGPGGERIAFSDDIGRVYWRDLQVAGANSHRVASGPNVPFYFGGSGTSLYHRNPDGHRYWELEGPQDGDSIVFKVPTESHHYMTTEHPNGRWLAIAGDDRLLFYPLGRPYPRVLSGHSTEVNHVLFIGDDGFLAYSGVEDNTIDIWPLSPDTAEKKVLWERPGTIYRFATNPSGEHLLVAHQDANPGAAYLVPIKNPHEPEANLWPVGESVVGPVTFSPDGRLAAAGTWYAITDDTAVIRAWDLETSQETVLQLREPDDSDELGAYERGVIALAFTLDGDLMSSGYGGVRLWDLETADSRWIVRTPEDKVTAMAPSDDCRRIVTVEKPSLTSSEGTNLRFHNLETGSSFQITTHGDITYRIALNRTGEVFASTGSDGVIKVGPTSGSEPHLLFGHEGSVRDLAFSSDGRWLASGGADRTVRLWPVPDVSKPPLHILPHEELIAKLKTLTNLRVVRDPESASDWTLTHDPFPGWETVPEW